MIYILKNGESPQQTVKQNTLWYSSTLSWPSLGTCIPCPAVLCIAQKTRRQLHVVNREVFPDWANYPRHQSVSVNRVGKCPIIEHHPTIWGYHFHRYLKVIFNTPQPGHLFTQQMATWPPPNQFWLQHLGCSPLSTRKSLSVRKQRWEIRQSFSSETWQKPCFLDFLWKMFKEFEKISPERQEAPSLCKSWRGGDISLDPHETRMLLSWNDRENHRGKCSSADKGSRMPHLHGHCSMRMPAAARRQRLDTLDMFG